MDNLSLSSIARLEDDGASVVPEHALLDVGIRAVNAPFGFAATRRARVLVWGGSVVAAVIAAGVFVAFAQQQLTLQERRRAPVEITPVVREAIVRDVQVAAPLRVAAPVSAPVLVAAPVRAARSEAVRAVPVPAPVVTPPAEVVPDGVSDFRFLLEADRCGHDPTCGI